jgi:hypothetical protein
MRHPLRLIAVGLVLMLALLVTGMVSAQEDLTSWFIMPDVGTGGTAASPTTTSSQVSVTIPSCQSKVIMGPSAYNGTPLSDFVALNYHFLVNRAGASQSIIYVNFYLDTDSDMLYDTRIDFAPSGNATGAASFDVLTAANWIPGKNSTLPSGSTWATVLATYPSATLAQTTFVSGYPSMVFNIADRSCAWSGWSGVFYAPTITLKGGPVTPGAANAPFQFADGRINNRDAGAPIAAYGQDDGRALIIYGISDGGAGFPALVVSAEDIAAVPAAPDANTLIASGMSGGLDISLWRLTSGAFQINVGQPSGKLYVLRFSEFVPGGGGYTSFETP